MDLPDLQKDPNVNFLSYFEIPEVILALVSVMNSDQLVLYYNRYPIFKEVLSSPHTLEILCEKFRIPYRNKRNQTLIAIESFSDFIVSYQIRYNKNICLNVAQILTIAIKDGDYELFNRAIDNPIEKNDSSRHVNKLFNAALKYQAPESIIIKLISLFDLSELFYHAAVLGRNDLLKKDPSGMYVYARDYKLANCDESMLIHAVIGNNLKLVMNLKDAIPDDYYHLLTIGAAYNSEEVIEYILSLFPDPRDDKVIIGLIMGYLAAGNAEKFMELMEPSDALLLDSDTLLHVIMSDNVELLIFIENQYGNFKISDVIRFLANVIMTDRLTDTMWELMIQKNSRELNEEIFRYLWFSDDYDGLIRWVLHFDPDFIVAESLSIKFETNKTNVNRCFMQWVKLQLKDKK